MRVTVIANRKDESRRLAFVKVETKRHGAISVPGYFDNDMPMPEIGEHEVMITAVIFPRNEHGHIQFDEKPKNFFLRVVTDKDILVEHEGFECSGSMCQTLAFAAIDGRTQKITPGRMMQYLPVADNVNAAFDKRDLYLLTPGKAYIERHPEKGHWRVAGVPSISELNI